MHALLEVYPSKAVQIGLLDKIVRSHLHLSPAEQTEKRKGSVTQVSLVPEYSTMIDL